MTFPLLSAAETKGGGIVPDGLIVMYVKGGKIYPVALTKAQYDMLQFVLPSIILGGEVRVIDQPQGDAVNLTSLLEVTPCAEQ
jgi:hypothetical protein